MASVRIEDEARRDPRFVLLGNRMGTSKYDARGRMEELWAYCTENQTYCMSEEVIDICAEFNGFAKLIESDVIGLGERQNNGLIRIKGTKGRIEWLKNMRKGAKSGGKSRIKSAQRDSSGRLVKNPAPDPGQSSVLTPTLTLTNNTNTGVFNFEEIWKTLPEGVKQKAKKAFDKYITSQEKYENLRKSTANYLEECNQKNRYLMHLSTFIGSDRTSHPWTEYIDRAPPQSKAGPPKMDPEIAKQFEEQDRMRKEYGLS